MPQVPTAKIITIAITIIALILTFFLISSIDSDSSPNNTSRILNEKESIEELKTIEYSYLPNNSLLTNLDFNTENMISGNNNI